MIVVVVTIGDVPSTKQHPAFYRPDAVPIGGRAVGQRGQLLPPPCRRGWGQRVSNAPPPFCRLSGMMPASTEKHRHI